MKCVGSGAIVVVLNNRLGNLLAKFASLINVSLNTVSHVCQDFLCVGLIAFSIVSFGLLPHPLWEEQTGLSGGVS